MRSELLSISSGQPHFSRYRSHFILDFDVAVPADSREAARRFPQFADKITALPVEVSDPFGGDDAVYRRCLERMIPALRDLAKRYS